jgi:hypothetical protein
VVFAHRLWKVAAVCVLGIPIFDSWLWRFTDIDPSYAAAFIFLTAISAAIVTIFFPEGFLISQTQIFRIINLYPLIERLSLIESKSTRTRELLSYLEELSELDTISKPKT